MCFLFKWNSRAKAEHYIRSYWPPRDVLKPGSHNVIREPLVKKENILLPPLHIKLGLIKQLVKALKHNQPAFQFLKGKFPKLSDPKVKKGIFVGPQIRKLMVDNDFEKTMNEIQLNAWRSFVMVCSENTRTKTTEPLLTN